MTEQWWSNLLRSMYGTQSYHLAMYCDVESLDHGVLRLALRTRTGGPTRRQIIALETVIKRRLKRPSLVVKVRMVQQPA